MSGVPRRVTFGIIFGMGSDDIGIVLLPEEVRSGPVEVVEMQVLIDCGIVDPVCSHTRLVPLLLLLDCPRLLLWPNCYFLLDSILPLAQTDGQAGVSLMLFVLSFVEVV